MAAAELRAPPHVAYLTFRREDEKAILGISQSDEFDIGRDRVRELLDVQDRSVSIHHLRFRCVPYEEEERRVAPLVYMRVLSNNAVILQRHTSDEPHGTFHVTKGYGDVLLNNGDHVLLTKQISFDFTDMFETFPPHPDKVQEAEIKGFASRYHLSHRVLGIGGQAAVYIAVKRPAGQQFACKVVDLRIAHNSADCELEGPQDKAAREYNILKRLSHPNIITLEKVFRTSNSIYIFQELFTGGDLLSYLDKTGRLLEPQSAVIVRQLLEAVKYLHANEVVHRDIKPENILMTCWREGGRVVLSDFGQSRTVMDSKDAAKKAGVFRMQSRVGTFGYTAPEIYLTKQNLEGCSGYSKAIDIWSIGCVTTTLLTNDWMFPDKEELQIGSINRRLQVLDGGPIWDEIGHRAKAFVRSCLAIDENQRPTAEECLQLAWFRHQHYKADFDALYNRAVADWQPKEDNGNIIEYLNTSNVVLQNDKNTRSHHFPVLQPTTLTAAPSNTTEVQGMLGRFRALDGPATMQHQAQQFGTPDDLSPFPEPPPFTSSMTMSRAHNFQQQFAVPGAIFATQKLPAPPSLSNFDNLDLAPQNALKAPVAKQPKSRYR